MGFQLNQYSNCFGGLEPSSKICERSGAELTSLVPWVWTTDDETRQRIDWKIQYYVHNLKFLSLVVPITHIVSPAWNLPLQKSSTKMPWSQNHFCTKTESSNDLMMEVSLTLPYKAKPTSHYYHTKRRYFLFSWLHTHQYDQEYDSWAFHLPFLQPSFWAQYRAYGIVPICFSGWLKILHTLTLRKSWIEDCKWAQSEKV